MSTNSVVSKYWGANFWRVAGFLVMVGGFLVVPRIEFVSAQDFVHIDHSEKRSCVIDELSSGHSLSEAHGKRGQAEQIYHNMGLYWEGPEAKPSFAGAETDTNILYWDMEFNRSCLSRGNRNFVSETFIDFNLRKILEKELGRTPDILVLDNCRSTCEELQSLHVLTARKLQSVYRSGRGDFNCEFIRKNPESYSKGMCLFWSGELKPIVAMDENGSPRADRVVDWVPFSAKIHKAARERFRFQSTRKLSEKFEGEVLERGPEISSQLMASFAPRVFETKAGRRIHVIPANVNKAVDLDLRPLLNMGWFDRSSVKRAGGLSPTGLQSVVHNQIRRFGYEFDSYFYDISKARNRNDRIYDPTHDDVFVMLGNFQVPSRVCSPPDWKEFSFGLTQSAAVMELGQKSVDVLAASGGLCNWPTAGTPSHRVLKLEDGEAVKAMPEGLSSRSEFDASKYVGLQTHHAYVRTLSRQRRESLGVRGEVLPLAGGVHYPVFVKIQ